MSTTLSDRISAVRGNGASRDIDLLMGAFGDSFDEQIGRMGQVKASLAAEHCDLPPTVLLAFARIGFDMLAQVWVENNKGEIDAIGKTEIPLDAAR